MSSKAKALRIDVRRQDGPGLPPRWETYRRDTIALTTVAELLDVLRREPVTADGARVAPIVWASGCTFPVCGSCAMLINGRAGLACATALSEAAKKGRITLAPLSKFSVRRDLWVDTSRMAKSTERLAAWHDPDATPAPRTSALRAALSRCTDCGCCVEACPETGGDNASVDAFVGAAALAAAHSAALLDPKPSRTHALLMPGGIDDCGRAENCVSVCPEAIPLDDAIGAVARDASRMWWRAPFGQRRQK